MDACPETFRKCKRGGWMTPGAQQQVHLDKDRPWDDNLPPQAG
jgi:hypothetical protein